MKRDSCWRTFVKDFWVKSRETTLLQVERSCVMDGGGEGSWSKSNKLWVTSMSNSLCITDLRCALRKNLGTKFVCLS